LAVPFEIQSVSYSLDGLVDRQYLYVDERRGGSLDDDVPHRLSPAYRAGSNGVQFTGTLAWRT